MKLLSLRFGWLACSVLFISGLTGSILHADTMLGPGWRMVEIQPPLEASSSELASIETALANPGSAATVIQTEGLVFRSTKALAAPSILATQSTALSVALPTATSATPELQALAAGLEYDWVKIFNYVRNKITYQPYYGSHKGAHLTYIDGAGNDLDQASLLIALLNQIPAGSVTNINYIRGTYLLPASAANGRDLSNWLGAPSGALAAILNAGNVPTYSTTINSVTYVAIDHFWVSASINGTTTYLDPSYKQNEIISGINLSTASGYNRNQIITEAAGTSNTDYALNIARGAVESRLANYTTSLASYIKNNNPSASTEQIIGGRRTIEAIAQTGFQVNLFANILALNTITDRYAATYRVKIGTEIDVSLRLEALQGKRLSITFSGNNAQLWLEDTLLAAETSGSGPSASVTLSISHPYRVSRDTTGNIAADVFGFKTQTLDATSYQRSGSYDLSYACYGNPLSSGRIDASTRRLQDYLASGLTDSSREVLTETLHGLGLKWVRRADLGSALISSITQTYPILQHVVGRSAQESGYYVDMPGVVGGFIGSSGTSNGNAFNASVYFNSALEHGVIEQNNGSEAASTIKCLALANDQAQRIYKVSTTASWDSTVSAQLTNYTTDQKTALRGRIVSGATLLLHTNGNTTRSGWEWKGYGYGDLSPGSVGMVISGGFSGGYNVISGQTLGSVSVASTYQASQHIAAPPAVRQTLGADPVDLLTGAFTLDQSDLTIGQSSSPRGLSFSRHYDGTRHFQTSALGNGWRHSGEGKITLSSELDMAFGLTQPTDAAQTIVGLIALTDFVDTSLSPKELMIGALAANWTVNRMKDNVANVQLGRERTAYVSQPDGTWTPPPGSTTALTGTKGSFVLSPRFGGSMTFDAQDRISTWKDVDNNTQTYSYDSSSGKLTTITDAFGRTLTFAYYSSGVGNGLLQSVTDTTSPSRNVQFAYTAGTYSGANLTTITDPESFTDTLVYDSRNRLTEHKDHLGAYITKNNYDALDRVTTQLSQGIAANTWKFYYSPGQTTQADPQDGKTIHRFDSKRRNVETVDPIEAVKSLATQKTSRRVYDGQNHVVSTTDPTGRTSTVTYDGNQNVTQSVDPAGKITTNQYDSSLRLWKTTDPTGRMTEFGYDSKHHLTDTWDPARRRSQTTYRTDGLPASSIAPDGKTTLYNAYDKAFPTSVTRPDGTSTSATYSPRGELLTQTDARGNTTTLTYDKRGLLKTSRDATGATTTYNYDSHGTLASVTDRNNQTTTTAYDNLGHLISATAPATGTVTQTYDSRDWLVSVTDALGHTSSTGYDAAGRRISATNALGTIVAQTGYDAAGRVLTQKDGLQHTTTAAYDGAGRLSYTLDPLTQRVDHTYDDAGRSLTLKNKRSKTYTFAYATDGLPTTLTSPTGRQSAILSRDPAGRPITLKNPSGNQTALTYDSLGRVKTQADLLGTLTSTYDNEGHLTNLTETPAAAGSTVNIVRVFDALGRVTSYTDAAGYTIGYLYDNEGSVTRITYPGNKAVNYTYDGAHRLKTVTDWSGRTTTYTYDTVGRLFTTDRPNSTRQRHLYDNANRLTASLEEKMSGVNIVSSLWQADYSYDNANRLTGYNPTPAGKTYAPPAATMTYNDDNQVATYNGQSITHDLDGNMLSVPVGTGPAGIPGTLLGTATWDARNRLLSAGGISYTYDAGNRRLTSTVIATGATTRYIYHKGGALDNLLAKINPDGSVTRYIYGAGLLYEETTTAGGVAQSPVYYHYNWRGDTVAMSDSTGSVVARLSYSPYGERTVESGATVANATPFGFNGRWGVLTEPNGLVCMQARFYSPTLRRFISEDPAGFSGGLNLYAFAGGNPVDSMDPFGLGPVSTASNWGIATVAVSHKNPWTDEGAGILANGRAGGGQPNTSVPFGPDYNRPIPESHSIGISNIIQGAGGFVPVLGEGMDGFQTVSGVYTAIKDMGAVKTQLENPDTAGLTRPNFNLPKGPDYTPRTPTLPNGLSDAVQGGLGFSPAGPFIDGYQLLAGMFQMVTGPELPDRKRK